MDRLRWLAVACDPVRSHTEDPNCCWCVPAVLLTPETKTVVHRWMLRDAVKTAWYRRFGWPPLDRLDPIMRSAMPRTLIGT